MAVQPPRRRVFALPWILLLVGLVLVGVGTWSSVVAGQDAQNCREEENGPVAACATVLASPIFFLLGLVFFLASGLSYVVLRRRARRGWQRGLFHDPSVPPWADR